MKKIPFLLILILITTFSCSRLDLAVSLANSYITSKTDDFFDLTWEQTKWLKENLVKDISKIKKTIFPLLALEMLSVADLLSSQKKFESTSVMLSYSRLEGFFYEGLTMLSPTANAFVDKLIPAQIKYFQKISDEKLSEMKEDSKNKTYKKMKKNFNSWMGGMTSEQKRELKEFIDKNPTPVKEIVYNRQRLVQGFIKAYPDKVSRHKFVEELFTKYKSGLDPTYKNMISEKNKRVADFFTNILNKMSDEQRNYLVDTIRDRANQLIKISKT